MEPDIEGDDQSSKVKNFIIELIEFVAIVAAILVVIRHFIAEPHRVSGNSMIPNFHNNDYIITNKLPARLGSFQRGEVIILKNPRNSDQVFIKRVVGLPGEKIKISSGLVYLNGTILQEDYLPPKTKTTSENFLLEDEEITIPENQYFVMGDNREASSDSREFGPIKKDLIIGQAVLRYWPLDQAELIKINHSST